MPERRIPPALPKLSAFVEQYHRRSPEVEPDDSGLWARAVIARGRSLAPGGWSLPRYRSADWLELPESDPVRVAAVVAAAECWWLDNGTDANIARRLRRELDELDYLTAYRMRSASYDVSGSVEYQQLHRWSQDQQAARARRVRLGLEVAS